MCSETIDRLIENDKKQRARALRKKWKAEDEAQANEERTTTKFNAACVCGSRIAEDRGAGFRGGYWFCSTECRAATR